jgi:hypothetical protein
MEGVPLIGRTLAMGLASFAGLGFPAGFFLRVVFFAAAMATLLDSLRANAVPVRTPRWG